MVHVSVTETETMEFMLAILAVIKFNTKILPS